ncbi:MAG: permease [Planctomycetes bacterium]|nr:permease [Planctomycetota bacterium]
MEIYEVILESAPLLIVGFLIGGMIKAFVAEDRIGKLLGKSSFGSIFLATAIGAPLPLCSCSVLPVAQSLRKQGASREAVSAFLISTPETGPDSVSLSFAFFHPLFVLFRVVAALASAMVCGVLQLVFGVRDAAQPPVPEVHACCKMKAAEEAKKNKRGLVQGVFFGAKWAYTDLFVSLAPHLVVGFVLTGLILMFVKPDFLQNLNVPYWATIGLALFIGVPLYVCATSSTPLAAAMIASGLSPGAGLIFLLTGPATNLTTLAAVRAILGTRGTALYLVGLISTAVAGGVLVDYYFSGYAFLLSTSSAVCHDHIERGYVNHGIAILFSAALLWHGVAVPVGKKLAGLKKADSVIAKG